MLKMRFWKLKIKFENRNFEELFKWNFKRINKIIIIIIITTK